MDSWPALSSSISVITTDQTARAISYDADKNVGSRIAIIAAAYSRHIQFVSGRPANCKEIWRVRYNLSILNLMLSCNVWT